MRNWFDLMWSALARAWDRQLDFPLPERMHRPAADGENPWELAALPVLGWLLGLVATLPGWLAERVFSPGAGALIFALVGFLALTFRDSGRSDGAVAAAVASALPGNELPWRLIVPVMLMIVRFALLLAVFSGGCRWQLPLVFAGIFAGETLLTLDGGFAPPLLPDAPGARRNFWIAAAAVTLISFLCGRLATALGAAAFVAVWQIFQRRAEREGTDLARIGLAGSLIGWVVLLAGLFAI